MSADSALENMNHLPSLSSPYWNCQFCPRPLITPWDTASASLLALPPLSSSSPLWQLEFPFNSVLVIPLCWDPIVCQNSMWFKWGKNQFNVRTFGSSQATVKSARVEVKVPWFEYQQNSHLRFCASAFLGILISFSPNYATFLHRMGQHGHLPLPRLRL